MFEKSASSNRQEMNGCSFQQVLREIGLVFVLLQESGFS